MQARFLLGPAGSGKTHRCLAEIRAELMAAPDGLPLILLAPKQATFQLERQLLAGPGLPGFTRLRILSFERLAEFVLAELHVAPPAMLSEQGRVMVLRALLMERHEKLKVFRASARLTGFAQQLSLLLREFQHHRLSPEKLRGVSSSSDAPPQLRDKLHDVALLLESYEEWLKRHALHDANSLLDVAVDALKIKNPGREIRVSKVWLDGFAEMTPQELDLLAAFLPVSESATLAFCLEREPESEPFWLSTWSVVAQTFRRCHARLSALNNCDVFVETLENKSGHNRFAQNEPLRLLEANWSKPVGAEKSGGPSPESRVRIAVCHDPESEAVLAAREILRHVRAGGRFRDCAVIVRSLEPYHAALDRVFRRYGIPCFMDRRRPASHHPLAELTRFALRTVAYNWRHDDWFGAIKSGLVTASEGAIDELENAALAFGWEGKSWREPFPPEVPHVERPEETRRRVMPAFERLASALAGKTVAGRQLAAALEMLWRDLEVEPQLEGWSDMAAGSEGFRVPGSEIHSGVVDQMRDWLENLACAFPESSMPLREWLPVLEAGLSGLTVGVIPPALDQVLIGAVDRSRNPDLKLALVLGLNEGVFPSPPAPGTLLTDTERAGLERADVYLGPTPRQRLGHERYLGYIACTRASERLVLTCAAEDGRGRTLNPSPFLSHVRRITGATEEEFDVTPSWWRSEHPCELAAPLLRMVGDDLGLAGLPALASVAEKWRQTREADAVVLSPAAVETLFGVNLKTSVSALEDFAACPFRFFAARGLRLQERKEFQVDDRDRGNFHHDVLDEFHRRATSNGGRWRDLDVKAAVELVGRIAREKLPGFALGKFQAGGAARFTGGILVERIQKLVGALIEWMPQYDFDPVASEMAFGSDEPGALPAWRIEIDNERALLLRGRIDRVDLCHLPDGGTLAVVMDYKSRARKLDNTKLYHGLELQLLSYLGVLQHVGELGKFPGAKVLRPAGVFYIPLNGGGGPRRSLRSEILKADNGARRSAYRHSGRFLADELRHFDKRGDGKGDQFVFKTKKDGTLAASGNEALPAGEFDALRVKVGEHLREYGKRIYEGEVGVKPFRIGNKTACDYCDFRPVCRFDPWTQPFRQLNPPPKNAAATKDE